MFDLKQATGQSVEDFLALVKKKAKKAQPTEDQLNATVIKGLRPYLRQQVLQHEPKSVEEIRKWALLAESTEGQEDRSGTELSQAVEEMKKQSAAVRDLQEQIQKIHLRGVAWGKPRDERSPSPGPRVRFNEPDRDRNGTPPPQRQESNNYRSNSYSGRTPYPSRGADQRSQETGTYSDRGSNQRFVPRNEYRNRNTDRSDQTQRNHESYARNRPSYGQSGPGNNGAQYRSNQWSGGRPQNQQYTNQNVPMPSQQGNAATSYTRCRFRKKSI